MKRSGFLKIMGRAAAILVLVPSTLKAGGLGLLKRVKAKIIRKDEGKSLNVLGDRLKLKLSGEETNGLFTLFEEEHDPGMMIPTHVHEREDEVFRVLEGRVAYTIAGKTEVLGEGDTAFGPRGIPHSWENVGTEPARVILSSFPSGIEQMFSELDTLPQGPPDFPKVTEICGRYGVRFLKK